MKKFLCLSLLAASLLPIAATAQVIVRVPPPRVVVERPVPPPGARYVWVGGYYRWTGVRYTWVAGHYAVPPRPRATWVAPH